MRHLQAMDFICRGHQLADVSAVLGSLDIVFGRSTGDAGFYDRHLPWC